MCHFPLSFSGNFGGNVELGNPHSPGDEKTHSPGWASMLLHCLPSSLQGQGYAFQHPEEVSLGVGGEAHEGDLVCTNIVLNVEILVSMAYRFAEVN